MKENNLQAIVHCARQLAKMLSENAVLFPILGHHGYSTQALHLVRAISSYTTTSVPVANNLIGKDRDSNFIAKKAGPPVTGV